MMRGKRMWTIYQQTYGVVLGQIVVPRQGEPVKYRRMRKKKGFFYGGGCGCMIIIILSIIAVASVAVALW